MMMLILVFEVCVCLTSPAPQGPGRFECGTESLPCSPLVSPWQDWDRPWLGSKWERKSWDFFLGYLPGTWMGTWSPLNTHVYVTPKVIVFSSFGCSLLSFHLALTCLSLSSLDSSWLVGSGLPNISSFKDAHICNSRVMAINYAQWKHCKKQKTAWYCVPQKTASCNAGITHKLWFMS